MKKALFAMLTGILALVSCSKDETSSSAVTYQQLAVASLPSVISGYIAENFPDAGIAAAFKLSNSDTVYAVALNTSELLAFNGRGGHLGNGETGLYCDSIGGDSLGFHHGGHHGGGHPGSGHHDFPFGGIAFDSVPAAITAYVASEFTGYSIHHAWNDTLCQFGSVIEVLADSTFYAHLKLVFTVDGQFLASAYRIRADNLPQPVLDAIAADYADFKLRNIAELFISAGGSSTIKVFMHNGIDHRCVVFEEDGSEVCTETGH